MKITIPFLRIEIWINEPKFKHKGIHGVTDEAQEILDNTPSMPRKKNKQVVKKKKYVKK